MKGLLYKDICLFRAEIIFLLAMQLLFSAVVFVEAVIGASPQLSMLVAAMLFFAMLLFVDILFVNKFPRDERHSWISFAASSPVGLDGQVRGKYYLLLVGFLLAFFCAHITDAVCCLILGTTDYTATMPFMVIFSLMLLWIAFELPFLFRFGSVYGNGMRMAALGVMLFLGIIYFLFGDISVFLKEDVAAAIKDWYNGSGLLLGLSFLPFAAVLGYYLSYRISLKVYRKGAQEYEQ